MWSNSVISGAVTINLILTYYAKYFKIHDLDATLSELQPDLGLPKIEVFDFIIGSLTKTTYFFGYHNFLPFF